MKITLLLSSWERRKVSLESTLDSVIFRKISALTWNGIWH